MWILNGFLDFDLVSAYIMIHIKLAIDLDAMLVGRRRRRVLWGDCIVFLVPLMQ